MTTPPLEWFIPEGVAILRNRGVVVAPSDVGRLLDALAAALSAEVPR